VPKRGSNIVWSEHNAVSFANSVLGARTNFESNIATVAAAITGRIPNYGLYLPENRRPSVGVSVTGKIGNAVDWRVLGVAAARVIGNKIPLFRVDSAVPTILNLRDLCAAMGPPWTACPMIHVDGVTAGSIDSPVDAGSLSNTVEITDRELDEVRAQLRAKRDQQIDLVALGCPQYSLDEIRAVADLLERQRVKTGVQLWVWTDRATRATAERLGLVKSIMKAGGEVIADTCGCAACPVSKSEHGFHNVATDSTKSCGFLNSTGLNTQLASLTECIDAAISGILVGPKIRRSSESGSN
jgi:predicted aconitase